LFGGNVCPAKEGIEGGEVPAVGHFVYSKAFFAEFIAVIVDWGLLCCLMGDVGRLNPAG
jgi:hypothetical protein